MSAREAGSLVKRYMERGGWIQEVVAHEMSQNLGRRINQNQVSNHVNGRSWGNDPGELARAYCDVLGIPIEEMQAAWGLADEKKKGPRPMTLADVVKADKGLTKSAKQHLLKQYELLLLASQVERHDPPPTPESGQSRRSSAR